MQDATIPMPNTLVSSAGTPASPAPALLILGTGGTIAGAAASAGQATGYQAGALPIGAILSSVPGLVDLVPAGALVSEQVFSIPSEQMDSAHWWALAARVRAWLDVAAGMDGYPDEREAEALIQPQPQSQSQPQFRDKDRDGNPNQGQHAAAARARQSPRAIVITHGTDTMEETAFFLSLVLPPVRPVVLTGAMRPATALSADGPANLYDACRFALAAAEAGIGGVFVQFGGKMLRADAVFKQHANQTDAFAQRFGALQGWLEGDVPQWGWGQGLPMPHHSPALPADVGGEESSRNMSVGQASAVMSFAAGTQGVFAGLSLKSADAPLPRVALLTQHVDADAALVSWLQQQGYAGVVLAGTGIGTMPQPMRDALAAARRQGMMVVRATRVPGGFVPRNTEARPENRDDALDFVTAGWLDAPKARILLQLCLAAGMRDTADIQAMFDRFHP